jgi:accessory gene regulator B
MIFAGSDLEMISKLAKSIAHFFVVQNISEESKEVIYAYGMELLISDLLNSLIVLLIALISHTLPAVIAFIAVFMGLRQFVGGYHANSHLSCMLTLVIVMLGFSYGICNINGQFAQIFSISFITIALPIIFCIAPVPHPNKPMTEEKGIMLKRKSRILAVALSTVVIALFVFQYPKLSLYISSGILLSAIMALLGLFLNRGDNCKR